MAKHIKVKEHIVREVAQEMNLPEREVSKVVESCFRGMKQVFESHRMEEVRLTRVGRWRIKPKRYASMIKNKTEPVYQQRMQELLENQKKRK